MPNNTAPLIRRGEIAARNITKKYAKTFYLASLLLPRKKRYAAYCLYALCRISDESVDTNSQQPELGLETILRSIATAYAGSPITDALLAAFREAVKKYNVPRECFDELIAGMRLDLKKTRYKDFSELYDYCYKVAGVVGLMMLPLLGYNDPRAKNHAVELGIAMQLTNILRDIREDLCRGRVYLPQDELRAYAISEDCLAGKDNSENLKRFLQFQIERAQGYYCRALLGATCINNLNSRLVILAMANMYAGILDKIRQGGYNVAKRARLNFFEKTWCLIKVLMKGRYL